MKLLSIILLTVILISLLALVVQPVEAKRAACHLWQVRHPVTHREWRCEIPVTYCNHPGPACVWR